jgi:glutamate-1-semialdehyde 2,1-aminomutase
MMTVFFGPSQVRNWEEADTVDRDRFNRFFHAAYDGGVLVPPSPFEAMFFMRAHRDVIDEAVATLVGAIRAAA